MQRNMRGKAGGGWIRQWAGTCRTCNWSGRN